jgi:glycerophosphoryl diester phosphodiesterase
LSPFTRKYGEAVGDKIKIKLRYYPSQTTFQFMRIFTESLVIAHRGASKDAPENTLGAFNLAWAQGADAIECDIRLSRDGRIVVMHDQSTLRTTGIDLVVPRHTAEELRSLDAGKWKSPTFTGEKIPFLEEVLKTVPPGKKLFIEIKCGTEIFPVLRELLPENSASFCTLIGFEGVIMAETKKYFPAHKVYWLCEFPRKLPLNWFLNDGAALVEQAKRLGMDGMDVRNRGLSQHQIHLVQEAGLEIFAWTVNSVPEAERMFSWGVQGITTDTPAIFRDIKV